MPFSCLVMTGCRSTPKAIDLLTISSSLHCRAIISALTCKANDHQFSEYWKENASPIITLNPIRPWHVQINNSRITCVRITGIGRAFPGVSHKRARGGALPKKKNHNYVTIRENTWEWEGQQRTKLKAGDPSYRHDPRRVVPVSNPLKHPELHSLIHTVTHLGGVGDMSTALLHIQRLCVWSLIVYSGCTVRLLTLEATQGAP